MGKNKEKIYMRGRRRRKEGAKGKERSKGQRKNVRKEVEGSAEIRGLWGAGF